MRLHRNYRRLNNTLAIRLLKSVNGNYNDCAFDPIAMSVVDVEVYYAINPDEHVNPATGLNDYEAPTKMAAEGKGDVYAEWEDDGFRIYVSETLWLTKLENAAGRLRCK